MSHQVPQCPCACSNKSGLICYICSTLIRVCCSKLFHEQFSLPGSRGNRAARNLAPTAVEMINLGNLYRQFRQFRSTMEYMNTMSEILPEDSASSRKAGKGVRFSSYLPVVFHVLHTEYRCFTEQSPSVEHRRWRRLKPCWTGAKPCGISMSLRHSADTPYPKYPKRYWAKQTDSSLDKTMCQLHPAARYIQI